VLPWAQFSCNFYENVLTFSRLPVQVIIEGFKSYREEISTEPFSPKVNVVGKLPLPFPHN
jgi:hypothetical protein